MLITRCRSWNSQAMYVNHDSQLLARQYVAELSEKEKHPENTPIKRKVQVKACPKTPMQPKLMLSKTPENA